jgi:putative nucleotidyltransferase with HDIG domain
MAFVESEVMADQSLRSEQATPNVQVCESLRRCFGDRFRLIDLQTGAWLRNENSGEPGDVLQDTKLRFGGLELTDAQLEVCRTIVRRGKPELIAEEEPVVILAAPVTGEGEQNFAAIALFVIHNADEQTIARAATALGFDPQEAACFAKAQTVWPADRLLYVAELALAQDRETSQVAQQQQEIDELSAHLSATYEELSLLYGLTQKLRISDSIEELGGKSLEWLAEAISAEGFLLELLPRPREEGDSAAATNQNVTIHESKFLKFGNCPVDRFQFTRLLERLDLVDNVRATVINPGNHSAAEWPLNGIRQAVVVPLMEGDNLFGWLAAFNHDDGGEFGSSEASLLSSVAAILGIHAGNIELYRRQAEFLSGVVRALTSAIDAKDPYTCGHSDRVARVSVKLADKIGCDAKELETIYLGGLLHDIGKIGIDDNVLRKPGKLSEAEYEHIKMHADIGYKILKDLKQLGQILPAVRHHHEAWDGSGYPLGLAGEKIPLYARIVAVADAFDAMSSDRPYRKGMPDEKLDEIFRGGAGKQWDAQVVDAFFQCRDEIRRIANHESEPELAEVGQMV